MNHERTQKIKPVHLLMSLLYRKNAKRWSAVLRHPGWRTHTPLGIFFILGGSFTLAVAAGGDGHHSLNPSVLKAWQDAQVAPARSSNNGQV